MDISYFYPIGFVIGSISCYFGYKYGKLWLNGYIINKVMKQLNNIQEEERISFQPVSRTKSALIVYKHDGKLHKVCVPYDRTKSRNMLRKKVFLVQSENNNVERIEITHKPGVPYLLSASDMGGIKIIVIKDNRIINTYTSEEIPNYLGN